MATLATVGEVMVAKLRAVSVYALGAAAPVLGWSQPAWACPVCFSAKNQENQVAYLATTGLMTFLPLMIAGGVAVWLRRRFAELDQPELDAEE